MGLFDFFRKKKTKNTPEAKEQLAASKKNTTTTQQFHKLNVQKVVQETADAISVYFVIPAQLKDTFSYKAGQYITLRVLRDGVPVLRSYSLSSSPHADTHFRVAIKRKKGGILSGYLLDTLKTGSQIDVFPPLGRFTPDLTSTTTHYFLFAGGSGITPMLSIAKSLLSKKTGSKVYLLYANRNVDSIIYAQEIDELVQKHKEQFEVQHILDDKTGQATAQQGIFQSKDYAQYLKKQFASEYQKAEHFICGPTPMMEAVEQALAQQLAISTSQIHIEYFDMSKQNTQEAMQLSSQSTTKKSLTTKQSDGSAIAQIVVGSKTTEVEITKDKTVLEATLDAGVDAPFMCEAGVCATCRAKLEKGKVEMRACYSLSDKEIAEGYILTCQALPETRDLIVNYDI